MNHDDFIIDDFIRQLYKTRGMKPPEPEPRRLKHNYMPTTLRPRVPIQPVVIARVIRTDFGKVKVTYKEPA